MPDTAVGLLGPTVVFIDGEVVDPGGRRIRRVLAALAIRAGTAVRTDRLIDDVWGDEAPPRARASLQMHISKLRRLLAATPVRIETVSEGYRLDAPAGAVDVVAFADAVDDARAARSDDRWETAEERSARALSLWRSDDLGDLDDMAGLSGEVTRLRELRRQACTIHAEALLALGREDQAVGELERAVADEPFVERFWELLMLALYRSGRGADALAAFRQASRTLGEELGIEPGPALRKLEEQILLHDEALSRPALRGAPRWTLPATRRSLVGRDEEIRRAVKRVSEDRLLVVLGPGGVGKTSLALEVAHRLAEELPDGGAFVDLSECDRDRSVPAVAAEQLGIDGEGDALAALQGSLRSRSMVLVVDNCEQVPDGAARLVGGLVSGCPDLIVIVTSRLRLDVGGAPALTLESLPVPPPDVSPEEAVGYAAVALFLARASEVAPDWHPAGDEMGLVVDLCRRLDGLPLAVELVTAWLNVVTLRDLAARLAEPDLLRARGSEAEGRPSRLADVIEWSYRLLAPEDQAAFERLGVFRSFFDLAGAAAVLDADPDEAMGTVCRLVDASLVVVDLDHHHGRYRMLETIRSFAARLLADRSDVAEVRARHRRHVLDTVQGLAEATDEVASFDTLQAMLADLRVVFDWAEREDPAALVDTAERLRPFWAQRGLGYEIEPRLERVLAQAPSAAGWYTLGVMRYARGDFSDARAAFAAGLAEARTHLDRARLVNALGVVSLDEGDYPAAAERYREAEEAFSASGHEPGVAAALLNQGIVQVNQGRLDEAEELFEEARRRFRALEDPREEAHALLRLAFVAELRHRPDVARERAQAALGIVRPLGTSLALADALQYTAEFELGAGSVGSARSLLAEAVVAFRDLGNVVGVQRALLTASGIAVHDEQWAEAAEMSAYAAALRSELGIPVPAANREAVAEITRAVAAAVPVRQRDALAERARLTDVDGMVDRCLDVLGVG